MLLRVCLLLPAQCEETSHEPISNSLNDEGHARNGNLVQSESLSSLRQPGHRDPGRQYLWRWGRTMLYKSISTGAERGQTTQARHTSVVELRNNDTTACSGRKYEACFDDGEDGEAFGVLQDAAGDDAIKPVVPVVDEGFNWGGQISTGEVSCTTYISWRPFRIPWGAAGGADWRAS